VSSKFQDYQALPILINNFGYFNIYRMNIIAIENIHELSKMIEKTFNPSFHGVVGGDRDILNRFLNHSAPGSYEKLRIASERIFAFSVGLAMPADHIFFDAYNDHINYYMAAGLAEKSVRTHYRNMNNEISKEDKEPEVLTMDHLGAAFVICFIPAIFGLIAFAGELYYARYIKRNQQKLPLELANIKRKPKKIKKFNVELDTNGI